ncbi:YxlC family protein [Pseudalkalibacillus hwajinpoensis]|uniref:YxlC family protein n=1 Tax=Guptibacillus hwajinpoensis TaxID=208199 RepID=UPI001CD4AA69|nr:YxlC family protein [Pseudalkalibacillus hwajinpoensis]
MNDKEDKKIVQHLKQDWQQIDDLGKESLSKVDMHEQLLMFQQKKKKAFYLESALFLLTAFVILTAVTISLFQAPIFFLIIQIVASLIVPFGVYFTYKKVNKKGVVSHDKP